MTTPTKEWQEKRQRILDNPYNYTESERQKHNVELGEGTPDAEEAGYKVKAQNINKAKYKKKKVDLRDTKRYGY